MYTRVFARTYDEFKKTMIQQSFVFVPLPVIGTDEPSMALGKYGSGAMGKIQFQSEAVEWMERFVETVMIPGCRVVQRLDPYCFHDSGPVHGMLALYVPRSKASAIRIKEVQVPPPSDDPSCGLVFVTQQGFPVERGDGWCISFDLAINDYEFDCITRLQCLLQGLCPRLPDHLRQARNRSKLCPEEAKRFDVVLKRTSATRHPKPLTLSDAICLVAFFARPLSEKRVRFSDELEEDASSPASISPPPTPTCIPPKRHKANQIPLLFSVPSPEPLERPLSSERRSDPASGSTDALLRLTPAPDSNDDSNEPSVWSNESNDAQVGDQLRPTPFLELGAQSGEIQGDAKSPGPTSPPLTPTGNPQKRDEASQMPCVLSVSSPEILERTLIPVRRSGPLDGSIDPSPASIPSPDSNTNSNGFSVSSNESIHPQNGTDLYYEASSASITRQLSPKRDGTSQMPSLLSDPPSEPLERVLSSERRPGPAGGSTVPSPPSTPSPDSNTDNDDLNLPSNESIHPQDGTRMHSTNNLMDPATERTTQAPPISPLCTSTPKTNELVAQVDSGESPTCSTPSNLEPVQASIRIYSPMTLSPFPSPLSHSPSNNEIHRPLRDAKNDQRGLTEEDEGSEESDEQEEYPDYLDDGIHTPMPLGISAVCPPEIDTRDRVIASPLSREPETGQQVQTPSEPSKICEEQGISRRYLTSRWYEYVNSIYSVSTYQKFQETIDDDHPVKSAYAFPGVDEGAMSRLYPCVVSLRKLGRWSRETFEVFGAATLKQAIELVLRINTQLSSKCSDVYVIMTGDAPCTNAPVDVPLDDEIPKEEVVLKRFPRETVNVMRRKALDGQVICAWQPSGIVYATQKQKRMKAMSGLGIPKRHHGHQPPICCDTDDDKYKNLYAQPKTLVISRTLQQIVRQAVPSLKSCAYSKRRDENFYFPTSITSSGDWLADHHLEIASAASRFIRERGRSAYDNFPLVCKLWSPRCSEMKIQPDKPLTLNDFLIYYLELMELISCSGTVLGDAVFFRRQRHRTADFILDVVFARAESLARLFKETDNKEECLWVFRTHL